MISAEDILQNVTELKFNKISRHNQVIGSNRSLHKGAGINFKEVRKYYYGDDIRFIDWNVSARMGELHSKLFEEEKELTIYLVVDISESTHLGSSYPKRFKIAQICADISSSVIKNDNRMGLLLFTDQIESPIKPSKKEDRLI